MNTWRSETLLQGGQIYVKLEHYQDPYNKNVIISYYIYIKQSNLFH